MSSKVYRKASLIGSGLDMKHNLLMIDIIIYIVFIVIKIFIVIKPDLVKANYLKEVN